MEANIVASRKFIIEFVNDFIISNDLIFFDDKNYDKKGIVWGHKVSSEDFYNKDILINVGSMEDFDLKIIRAWKH